MEDMVTLAYAEIDKLPWKTDRLPAGNFTQFWTKSLKTPHQILGLFSTHEVPRFLQFADHPDTQEALGEVTILRFKTYWLGGDRQVVAQYHGIRMVHLHYKLELEIRSCYGHGNANEVLIAKYPSPVALEVCKGLNALYQGQKIRFSALKMMEVV